MIDRLQLVSYSLLFCFVLFCFVFIATVSNIIKAETMRPLQSRKGGLLTDHHADDVRAIFLNHVSFVRVAHCKKKQRSNPHTTDLKLQQQTRNRLKKSQLK
jgi:hypothetical protein